MQQQVVQRAMATAAHEAHDDHHGPYWVTHPFHVLPPSPWPVLGGYGAGVTCLGEWLGFFVRSIYCATAGLLGIFCYSFQPA